jgi:hypothetical protein
MSRDMARRVSFLIGLGGKILHRNHRVLNRCVKPAN